MNTKKFLQRKEHDLSDYSVQQYSCISAVCNWKNKALSFIIPALAVKRDDTIDMQQRILAITPREMKRLGINKSTLWYKKKKLTEGKRVKIYKKS